MPAADGENGPAALPLTGRPAAVYKRGMAEPLRINHRLTIPAEALEEAFVTASGPGGQNVNKVATAVQLRFRPALAPDLPDAVLARLRAQAGRRWTADGLLITAREHRTQERNREAARERLADLIRAALIAPVARRPTRPTKASKERRLVAKQVRSTTKAARGRVRDD
ncbi:alternative ribosome rescue aminoacyl-tRNA hydrolase ArfB [Roseomonas sp. CCTCC AB2023176]|uniref:alternative ribosome rescue aminoacyl-tRNA hydrolase ArfB n=1 Tax=Roseomonas sp. CCTCC AB2023176 TaxID=3342640 RepID=UPI0035D6FE2A